MRSHFIAILSLLTALPALALQRPALKFSKAHEKPRSYLAAKRARPDVMKKKVSEIKLSFHGPGVEGKTFYNPAPPEWMAINGVKKRVLAVRAEDAHRETGTEVWFFEEKREGEWHRIVDENIPALRERNPLLKLQDPSVAFDGPDLFVSGVAITGEAPNIKYRVAVYRAPDGDLAKLETAPVFEGDWGKKGTRFHRLPDKRLLVLSRPQGGEDAQGGRGKISRAIVEGSVSQAVLEKATREARVFSGLVGVREWIGPNRIYDVSPDTVFVLSHWARFAKEDKSGKRPNDDRDYAVAGFFYNHVRDEYTPMEILLDRHQLPGGLRRLAKRSDLKNVLYPAGFETGPDGRILVDQDGRLTLWLGEGDRLIGCVKIPNFLP